VAVRDADTLASVTLLDELRGANTFCVREYGGETVFLCFCVKRQLIVVEYADGQYQLRKVPPRVARALALL
jgi:hypothetical protein